MYNPWAGPKLSKAWLTALEILDGGQWEDIHLLVEDMCEDADVVVKTCMNMIHAAIRDGALQRKGKYVPFNKRNDEYKDGRSVRLPPGGLPELWRPDEKDITWRGTNDQKLSEANFDNSDT